MGGERLAAKRRVTDGRVGSRRYSTKGSGSDTVPGRCVHGETDQATSQGPTVLGTQEGRREGDVRHSSIIYEFLPVSSWEHDIPSGSGPRDPSSTDLGYLLRFSFDGIRV